MEKMSINEVRSLLFRCAKEYKIKLCDRQFLIIFKKSSESDIYGFFEAKFKAGNFQHLSGIEHPSDKKNIQSSAGFFRKCYSNKLSNSEIVFKKDGTTRLKLKVLPYAMDFVKLAKMVGIPDDKTAELDVSFMSGGIKYCLGFRKDEDSDTYIPVTLLDRDIRTICTDTYQILGIMEKACGDQNSYNRIRYTAKNIDLSKLNLPDEIKNRIQLSENKD